MSREEGFIHFYLNVHRSSFFKPRASPASVLCLAPQIETDTSGNTAEWGMMYFSVQHRYAHTSKGLDTPILPSSEGL